MVLLSSLRKYKGSLSELALIILLGLCLFITSSIYYISSTANAFSEPAFGLNDIPINDNWIVKNTTDYSSGIIAILANEPSKLFPLISIKVINNQSTIEQLSTLGTELKQHLAQNGTGGCKTISDSLVQKNQKPFKKIIRECYLVKQLGLLSNPNSTNQTNDLINNEFGHIMIESYIYKTPTTLIDFSITSNDPLNYLNEFALLDSLFQDSNVTP